MMALMSPSRAQIASVRVQIARRVRRELAAADVTGRSLAPRLDLSPHGMARRLRGDVVFRADELVFIAAILGIRAEQLLEGVTVTEDEDEESDPPGRRPAMVG
jgi:hypothetical protein